MKATHILAFALGAMAGSVGTWYAVRSHYEALVQEEVDSVKESFKKLSQQNKKLQDDLKEAEKTADILADRTQEKTSDVAKYAKKLAAEGYTKYSEANAGQSDDADEEASDVIQPEIDESRDWVGPYVISPDQFGEFDDYARVSLTYFADDVVADEDMACIGNPESLIGDALEHFGEYEDDSVHVRNERLKIDYEILRDLRKYEDILRDKPYIAH